MCELIPEFWMVHKGEEEVSVQRRAYNKGSCIREMAKTSTRDDGIHDSYYKG